MRNAEMRHLQIGDIDSRAMLIHIRHGKGGHDRYVPLSAALLATLRAHCRWMQPTTYLFPGTLHNWRADRPITPKVVWDACRERRAPSRPHETRLGPHCCGIRLPRICSKRGPTSARSSCSSAMPRCEHTVLYLHLSQRHLQAVANPLEALAIPAPETVYKSRRLHKR